VDTILGILSGESYSGIRAFVDLSVCINLYQQPLDNESLRESFKELTDHR
jgi:hypothetical protein